MKSAAFGNWLLMVLLGIGCSESAGPGPSIMAPACVPGQQVACACSAGAMGVQVCNDQGTGLASCDCGAATSDAAGDRSAVGGGGGSASTDGASFPGEAASDGGATFDGGQGGAQSLDDPGPTAGGGDNLSSTAPNPQTWGAPTCKP